MLHNTRRCCVVFTQGFPILERFAQAHFLPSNPFSSSCLWLDEDDFRSVELTSKQLGIPYPMRIDPYAHHPVLSRFAVKKPTGKTNKELCDAPLVGRRELRTALHAIDASSSSSSAAAAAAPRGVFDSSSGSSSSSEQRIPRRGRGRPRKSTVPDVQPVPVDGVRVASPSNYQVPIFSLYLTKPLFLFNLDQMYLIGRDGGQGPLGSVDWDAGTADETLNLSVPMSMSLTGNVLPVGATAPHAPHTGATTAASGDGLCDLLRQNRGSPLAYSNEFADSSRQRMQDGVEALQRMFPDPPSGAGTVMHSINTRRPYGGHRQSDLRSLAQRHGYRSVYWGTRHQWRAVGAYPLPQRTEHIIPVSSVSKIVHISLIEDAAALLQHSYISPRRRKICYVAQPIEEWGTRSDYGSGVMGSGVVMDRPNASSAPARQPNYQSNPTSFGVFFREMQADMHRMNYKLPLYLSPRNIAALGLSVRPGAQGIDACNFRSATTPSDETDADDATLSATAQFPPPPARAATVSHRCWYHISQVHFPHTHLLSSAVLSAEMTHPGVALHGTTGAPLDYPELSYASLVDHHPEVAAVLLKDGEASPPPSALTTPADSHPEKSGGAAVTVPEDEAAIAAFVSTHASPKLVRGRHLWFLAEDVLAANGIVDVNSAPVEVVETHTKTVRFPGGVSSDGSGRESDADSATFGSTTFFNVELLDHPDEALRKLSIPFPAE